MNFLEIIGAIIVIAGGISAWFFRRGGVYNQTQPLNPPTMPQNSPVEPPIPPTPTQTDPDSIIYPWDTPSHCYHNTRVLCDKAGLSIDEKNDICACIYQESRFKNSAKGVNKNKDGSVSSTDWGIVQVNDYFHIGKGKDFPSVEYVLANPDKCVQWMIDLSIEGKLRLWSSYSTGAYKQWLSPNSPMWKLST